MSFIQLIEIQSPGGAAPLEALHEEWRTATEGQRTVTSELICEDRDRPGTFVLVVEFPSWDEAMKNNELPATARIAEQITELSTTPPTFRNLDVLRRDT